MTKYLLYDPTGSVDQLFPLPHACEKSPDKVINHQNVILVEDSHLDRLLTANKEHVQALFIMSDHTAANFASFKKRATYVLELPPEKEEVEALASVLQGNIETSELDMSAILPPEVVQKYEDSIDEKIIEVENIIKQIEKQPTKELLVELRNSIHKFAGNAASYGYVATTPLCRTHEAFLEGSYDSIPKDQLVDLNRKFFRKFKLTMQKLSLAPIKLK